MISLRNILAIAVKELRSYFASPMAYLIIGLFLVSWLVSVAIYRYKGYDALDATARTPAE